MAHAHRADHIHHKQCRSRVGAHLLEANGVGLVEAPGRVHEHVDPAIGRLGLLDEAIDRRLIGDVQLMGRGGATGVDDLCHRRLGLTLRAAVADQHRGPLASEPARNRPAQRPAGTGYKSNPTRKPMAVIPGRLHHTLPSSDGQSSQKAVKRATERRRSDVAVVHPLARSMVAPSR